ncbi:hypothetical protein AOLI_G00028290 [Acnodon oligacanthus]
MARLSASGVASRDRIVVSTLRCGRSNPGSNPGHGRTFNSADSPVQFRGRFWTKIHWTGGLTCSKSPPYQLLWRCPYQYDRYLTTPIPVDGSSGLQFPSHYKRFVLKMFTFVDPDSKAPWQERVTS